MIRNALETIAQALSKGLPPSATGEKREVEVAQPKDEAAPNTLTLSMVGITQENSMQSFRQTDRSPGPPPLTLNATILVSANCDTYPESLDLIEAAVKFFHDNPIFTKETTPALESEKLAVQLENGGLDQSAKVWGMLKKNYRPSAIYRLSGLAESPQS